jgi:pyruvate formate lyase activating enzyme
VSRYQERLGLKAHPARLFTSESNGDVTCHLSPRHCRIRPGQAGFCQVRKNENGKLVTLNYGVSVEMTQEIIETEAVAHFAPGAPILSLGNIGCMLACDFCHNWKTSQMKHVEKQDLNFYSPQQVVDAALEKKIPILSWTYNDPVVWHEFVVDTSRLAKEKGLLNLYKSAFAITPEAIDELHPSIDIFSLSLKSLDPVFYKKVAKGSLEPVLEAIRHIYLKKDRHIELSNLIVTGLNDNFVEVEKMVAWVLKNLDSSVPLHLVRFHPDYKYTHVDRTSIPFLKKARDLALSMGMQHVYLGNVYEELESLETHCKKCESLLVKRFGLRVKMTNLDASGFCTHCGEKSPITLIPSLAEAVTSIQNSSKINSLKAFDWNSENQAAHVVLINDGSEPTEVMIRRIQGDSSSQISARVPLKPQERWRMIVSRESVSESGFQIAGPLGTSAEIHPILDRAHYPSEALKPAQSFDRVAPGVEF